MRVQQELLPVEHQLTSTLPHDIMKICIHYCINVKQCQTISQSVLKQWSLFSITGILSSDTKNVLHESKCVKNTFNTKEKNNSSTYKTQ